MVIPQSVAYAALAGMPLITGIYASLLPALVAVLFACKLGWEHLMGPLPFTASTLGLPVIHEAHTYGAIGGTLMALWLLSRRRTANAPL